MADSTRKSQSEPARNRAEKQPVQENPAESSMCLLWRCLACGATRLGTIDQKPEQCENCGGSDFEFREED